ncbi:MAG: hypothetical protein ACRDFB_06385 [Rhabdochlamydiaceae bacterium]
MATATRSKPKKTVAGKYPKRTYGPYTYPVRSATTKKKQEYKLKSNLATHQANLRSTGYTENYATRVSGERDIAADRSRKRIQSANAIRDYSYASQRSQQRRELATGIVTAPSQSIASSGGVVPKGPSSSTGGIFLRFFILGAILVLAYVMLKNKTSSTNTSNWLTGIGNVIDSFYSSEPLFQKTGTPKPIITGSLGKLNLNPLDPSSIFP